MDNSFYPNIYCGDYLSKTVNLSSSARNLLDVFILYMVPEENLILFCDGGMDFYLQYCRDALKLNYAEKTVRNAISELSKQELILKFRKDIYYVNPRYFLKMHFNFDHKKLITKVEYYTGKDLMSDRMKEVSFKKQTETQSASAEYNTIDEQQKGEAAEMDH